MALIDTPDVVPSWVFRENEQPKPGADVDGAGFADALPSAFRQNNTIGSLFAYTASLREPPATLDPNFDPFKDIAGYEENAKAFAFANTPEDVAFVKSRIDREREDKRILAEAGWAGVGANMVAGILDPVNLIPVGGVAYNTYRTGGSILKGAAVTASSAAATATAVEAGLQATQITREFGESATNIAATAVLGGMLGAGAGALARRAMLGRDLTADVERNLTIPDGDDPFVPNGFVMSEGKLQQDLAQSFGSAGVRRSTLAEEQLKGAFGLEKFEITASLRLAGSPALNSRIAAQRLMDTPYRYEKNTLGIPTYASVENKAKLWNAALAETLNEMDNLFVKYRTGNSGGMLATGKIIAKDMALGEAQKMGKLTHAEFKVEIAKALRRGDQHEIPEVAKAASAFRSKVLNPFKDEAVKLGLLDEGVNVDTAQSYLYRVWDTEKIAAKYDEFVQLNKRWLQSKEPPDSTRNLDDVARLIADRILGNPAGRTPYDVAEEGAKRGKYDGTHRPPPMKARVYDIPDEMVEEFLENDIEVIAKMYTRTMAPAIEMVREFGDTSMEKVLAEIEKEFSERIRTIDADVEAGKYGKSVKKMAETDKAKYRQWRESTSTALKKESDADIGDLMTVRDRIYGFHGLPENPNGWAVRTGRVARNISYLTLLGGMALNSISDAGKVVMAHGMMSTMRDGIVPLIRNFKGVKMASNEVKLVGAALDVDLDSRAMALAEIMDDYGRGSKFERGLNYTAGKFGTLTGMNHLNSSMKKVAGMVTMTNMFKAAERVAANKGVGRDVEDLAMNGISPSMAKRLIRQFEKNGEIDRGVYLPRTALWDDPEAVTAFRVALQKQVNSIIVTPSAGDLPNFMSSETGKFLMQFKSFAISSFQRTAIWAAQKRDRHVLEGITFMTALGVLNYMYNQTINGKEISDDPATLIKEGIDRSGLLALPFEANNALETLTKGRVGLSAVMGQEPATRFRNRSIVDVLAGPGAGVIEKGAKVAGASLNTALGTGEFTESDIKALRRILPFQNHFALRFMFDEAEAAINEVFDIPKTQGK